MALYNQRVNPALRKAVADCASIRESNFRSMQLGAIVARDEARRATIMVAAISAVALIISTLVALALARRYCAQSKSLATPWKRSAQEISSDGRAYLRAMS